MTGAVGKVRIVPPTPEQIRRQMLPVSIALAEFAALASVWDVPGDNT